MITHHSKARQRGAALVLFLGVVIALSVLSIALVGLISNARHLTSRDKSRTTAFDVAEAAIDVTMQALSGGWPTEEHPWTPASFATEAPGFAAEFGVTNGATQGDAVWVSVVDDPAGSTTGYDEDTNSRVWVDAQARVNGVSARIRAMVQAKFYEMNVPKGVAVCADGSLYSNASDGNTSAGKNKIGAQDVSIGGPQPVAIAIWGAIQNPEVAWPYVDQNPPTKPHPADLVTPDLITDLTQIADQTGKLFENGALPGHDDFYGLCVVRAPAGTTITLGQNGKDESYNDPASPGILLVLGGADL